MAGRARGFSHEVAARASQPASRGRFGQADHGIGTREFELLGSAGMEVRERVVGLDPGEFWARPLAHAQLVDMRDKYEAELALANMPADSRGPAIRELARRWPGSLREAELIGPARVEARLAAAAAGCERDVESGELWRARGDAACAVVLWSHLHPAIAELLELRRRGHAMHALTWPGLDRLPELHLRKLDVRVAYLWLAARAGTSLPALGLVLFARSGHWDRRPGDPEWAAEFRSPATSR